MRQVASQVKDELRSQHAAHLADLMRTYIKVCCPLYTPHQCVSLNVIFLTFTCTGKQSIRNISCCSVCACRSAPHHCVLCTDRGSPLL